MLGLLLSGLLVLSLFLLLYWRPLPGRCVKGCHGCGECGRKKEEIKEELRS